MKKLKKGFINEKKTIRQGRLVGRSTCNYASSSSLRTPFFPLNGMYGTKQRILGITKLKLISDTKSYFTPDNG